jgi:hypothetical protein
MVLLSFSCLSPIRYEEGLMHRWQEYPHIKIT